MSARGFGSLVTAATVVGTALGCYLISLEVASERAELERVEAEIAQTQRAIRVLETEIGTRGRLAQLEKWNANFMRLSAPSADQILEGSFQLATMIAPPATPALEAPVVLAAATTGEVEDGPEPEQERQTKAVASKTARPDQMLVQAGLRKAQHRQDDEEEAADRSDADPLAPKPVVSDDDPSEEDPVRQ